MQKHARIALSAAILGTALAAPAAADATVIRTGGSTGLQLLAQKLATAYQRATHVRVTVTGGGSGAGISGASAGRFDIGNSSRKPKVGDPSGLYFTPITKEPFVVIDNPRNPVKSLTQAQIKGIFTGTITSWRAVGGPNKPIKVYTRVGTSGTLSTFKDLFLDGDAVKASAPALASNGLMRSAVANNTYAIGFVTYAYTVGQRLVRPLSVAGVAPSLRNVVSGRYRYWGYQYFVTKGAPAGAVRAYVTWVRGPHGAAVIRPFAIPTTVAAQVTP